MSKDATTDTSVEAAKSSVRHLGSRPLLLVVGGMVLLSVLIAGVGISAAVFARNQVANDPVLGSQQGDGIGLAAAATTAPASFDPSITVEATSVALFSAPQKAMEQSAGPSTELYAFYVNWGDEAYESLVAHADDIDVLVPMWYHLGSNGKLTVGDPVEQAQVMALVKRENPDMKVMPLVNNYDKSSESWNAPAVAKLLRDPAKRVEIAKHIVETLDAAGFDGVNIDFESFTEDDREVLVAFMEELYPRAKKAGLTVSMDVIVGSKAYDHPRLAQNVDFMVPMMYDEHWKTSPAGPISSQPWFERTLQRFYEQVPPEKVVVGLGVYSYDYGKSGKRAASLTWQDAVTRAAAKDKVIELDTTQKNAHFTYKDGSTTHNVWMLDAVSAFNQMAYAADTGARGYAFWRLGAEDPGLWKVIPERDSLDAEAAASLKDSRRSVRYDGESGLIVEERFEP